MSHTLQQIRQLLGDSKGLLTRGTFSADVADGSYILDTTYSLMGAYQPTRWPRGSPVRVHYYTGATLAYSQSHDSTVDRYDPATGKVYLTPSVDAVTVDATNSATYEIWQHVDEVARVDRAINRGLSQHCYLWRPVPLTAASDGDMGDSGTSLWTLTNTPTVAKVALNDLPFAGNYLSITSTGVTGGFAQPAAIPVTPGDTWYCSCFSRASASPAGAKIYPYDLTNSATITAAGDTDLQINYSLSWVCCNLSFTIPAGCYSMTVKLGHLGNSMTTHYAQLALWEQSQRRFTLPARIQTRSDVGERLIRKGADEASVRDLYMVPHDRGGRVSFVEDGANGVIVELSSAPSEFQPVYVEELTTAAELSTETATTLIPIELAVDCGWYELSKEFATMRGQQVTLAGYPVASEWEVRRREALKTMQIAQRVYGPGNRED